MEKYLLAALAMAATFWSPPSTSGATHDGDLSASPRTAALATSGTIAFVVAKGGDDFIDTMTAMGTDVHQLTNCGPGECYPSWSPDGREIAFQGEFDGVGIYVMNANGTDVRRLSPTPAADVRPSWSANGKEIIFSRVVGPNTAGGIPNTEIDVMNANGTDVRTILPADGTFNIEPRWSPTASTIVFMSGRNHSQQIYTMTAGGRDLKMITSQGANGDPFWSPNGARISFGSDRQGGGRINVYTMSASGGHVRAVTHFSPPFEAGDTSWSPNGAEIAFEVDRGGEGQSNPNVPASVWTVHSNGSGAVNTKVRCASVGCAPRWRPTP
jgi:Tol biopolymer transport system component